MDWNARPQTARAHQILDMCRTVVNVTGDLAIAACVAKSEPADDSGQTSLYEAESPA